jgi:hypothetical protein
MPNAGRAQPETRPQRVSHCMRGADRPLPDASAEMHEHADTVSTLVPKLASGFELPNRFVLNDLQSCRVAAKCLRVHW